MHPRRRFVHGFAALGLLASVGCGGGGSAVAAADRVASNGGIAAGDVDARSAVLWARATEPGIVQFEVTKNAGFSPPVLKRARLAKDTTLPVTAHFDGLSPGTTYHYRAGTRAETRIEGTFRTAMPTGQHVGLHFGLAGDWRGDMAPYPSVRNAAAMGLDVFVELGDTVYADVPSPDVPAAQALTLSEFRAKHAEVYSARFGLNTLADVRRSAAILAMLDDHEIMDDWAGAAPAASDPRFLHGGPGLVNQTLLDSTALEAFIEYNPIEVDTYRGTRDDAVEGRPRLYRYRTFGSDAALILVDARSFRSPELPNPDPSSMTSIDAFRRASFDPTRTMLGAPQLDQAEADLLAAANSGFTWKFVLIPEPIQNFGVGDPRDRFEGYAYERSKLLAFVREHAIPNVVFVTADIHGTVVNNLQYQATSPDDPQIDVDAFEISAPAVAYDPPLAEAAVDAVSVTPIDHAIWDAMSMDAKDDLFKTLLDQELEKLGFDPTGLDGSSIDAHLLEGKWVRANAYGWLELEIDPVTQVLTITMWGIDWYHPSESEEAASREPTVLLRFTVNPKPL